MPAFIRDTRLEKRVLQIRMKAAADIMDATVDFLTEEENKERTASNENLQEMERIIRRDIFNQIQVRDLLRTTKAELQEAIEPENVQSPKKENKKLITVQPTNEDIFDPMAATIKYRVEQFKDKNQNSDDKQPQSSPSEVVASQSPKPVGRGRPRRRGKGRARARLD